MIRYTQGAGTSKSDAIKIVGAKNDWDGVAAEYALLRSIFRLLHKKWELLFQALIHDNRHSYDWLVVRDEDDTISNFWFEITDFFGKW